jgi:gluconolactonase
MVDRVSGLPVTHPPANSDAIQPLGLQVRALSPQFSRYVLHNASLQRLATGCSWTEGPVWFGDANCLLFSDIPNDRILRWGEAEGVSVYRAPSQFANGGTRDREGRLLSCLHGARAIARTEYDGSVTVLADRYQGKRLNSPNDIVVKSDGTIWFTDPHYGIMTDYEGCRADQELPCHVYRFDPSSGSLSVVADDFKGPNGLAFSPDESRLYVADTGEMFDEQAVRHIRIFDLNTAGDRLTNGRAFHAISPGAADGFRCDEDGNIWSSAADGVHCIAPHGELLGKILVPERVANVAFGGRARNRLFMCATSSLYAVYLNRRGAQRP